MIVTRAKKKIFKLKFFFLFLNDLLEIVCMIFIVNLDVPGCTVYSVECTVYSVQRTAYSVQCTVQCTVYSVYSVSTSNELEFS